jgi:hypothetical protein
MSSGGSYFDYAAGKQDARQGRHAATAKQVQPVKRERPLELPPELTERADDGTTIIKAIRGAILRKLARGE